MLKNITFSAQSIEIENARNTAKELGTSLNKLFQQWIKEVANHTKKPENDFHQILSRLSYVKAGKKFTRNELNER